MFEEKIQDLFMLIQKKRWFVLSTSLHDKVTSRTMSTILFNQKIYFQTDKNFEKTKQIIENPNVALCIDNIQIEGVVKIIGKTMEQEELAQIYACKHPKSYRSYSHLENTIMMEVVIKKATLWEYKQNHSFRYFYDFDNRTYREEKYI